MTNNHAKYNVNNVQTNICINTLFNVKFIWNSKMKSNVWSLVNNNQDNIKNKTSGRWLT